MGWFANFRRRRALKRLARRMPAALREDYGHRPPYAPLQVQATMNRQGLADRDLVYALALFCPVPAALDSALDGVRAEDLEAARTEMGDLLFDGDSSFAFADVEMAAADDGSGLGGGVDSVGDAAALGGDGGGD
jgi:hypothetical protein